MTGIVRTLMTAGLALNLNAAFGHGSHKSQEPSNAPTDLTADLNHSFESEMRSLFNASCTNCHSSKTSFPFYYKLPGVRQLIDKDIKEAREHLDMTDGFPFRSHSSLANDLKALRKSIETGRMPPWRYITFHPQAKLSRNDREKILNWIEKTERKIK